jgi:Putative amidoligase enzyme
MKISPNAPQEEALQSRSTKGNSAIVPLSKRPLTWGVELEFVFAFHESQLQLVGIPDVTKADGYFHPTTVQKNIWYKLRRHGEGFKIPVPWEILPGRVYNSWGLYNEAKPPKKLTPYQQEVENVLLRVLESKCPFIATRVDESKPIDEKKKDMYNEWLKYSVCGVGSQNITTWLPRVDSTTDWDSYGLELVSPVFQTGSNRGFKEIALILEATKGKSPDLTGAFITNQCGLHVHVQAPNDFAILKELAVLVVVYESEIAKLHPHCLST